MLEQSDNILDSSFRPTGPLERNSLRSPHITRITSMAIRTVSISLSLFGLRLCLRRKQNLPLSRSAHPGRNMVLSRVTVAFSIEMNARYFLVSAGLLLVPRLLIARHDLICCAAWARGERHFSDSGIVSLPSHLQVRVRNLTYLQPFSPPLIVAHTKVKYTTVLIVKVSMKWSCKISAEESTYRPRQARSSWSSI